MGYSTFVADWLEKSEKHLKSSKILFEHDCGNDIVAFHCQQAAEKALKALILYYYSSLESGHSLIYLCKKLGEKASELLNKLKDCAFLNQYYIETRYLNENAVIVTNDEAIECIKIAEDILSIVNAKIKEVE